MRIEEMIHCCHTVRCLHAAGIDTMEQLSALSMTELLDISGIGKVIAANLSEIIKKYQPRAFSMAEGALSDLEEPER